MLGMVESKRRDAKGKKGMQEKKNSY